MMQMALENSKCMTQFLGLPSTRDLINQFLIKARYKKSKGQIHKVYSLITTSIIGFNLENTRIKHHKVELALIVVLQEINKDYFEPVTVSINFSNSIFVQSIHMESI